MDEAEVVMCGDEDKGAVGEVDGDDEGNDIEHSTGATHDHHNGHTHAIRAHGADDDEEEKAEQKRVDSFNTRPFPLEAAASGLGKSNKSTRSISSWLQRTGQGRVASAGSRGRRCVACVCLRVRVRGGGGIFSCVCLGGLGGGGREGV